MGLRTIRRLLLATFLLLGLVGAAVYFVGSSPK